MDNVKERPIIFSGEMVSAILDGRKTQTRRVVKGVEGINQIGRDSDNRWWHWKDNIQHTPIHIRCPYGKPGDRLWVRETFIHFDQTPTPTGEVIPGGYGYRADLDDCGQVPVTDETGTCLRTPKDNWKPSIYMPRAASRITLEITNVRVERLQSISEADAIAEGIANAAYAVNPVTNFGNLWDKINGKKHHPWAGNPWVWVIEFKKI